jgi:hypothetical protein
MPKRESELPADISARLDQAIARCAANLRKEVAAMFRFANMDEIEAAKAFLEECGKPMPLSEIVEGLKAGGIWRPATESYGSSVDVEMRRSISRAAAHGVNLRFFEREKELIGLASWPNKMGR